MNDRHPKIEVLVHAEKGVELPHYASLGASGSDVRANIREGVVLDPGATEILPTGLFFSIPAGYEIQVRPRSGLAAKQGITVLNTPGTIDADYRGELKVLLFNLGKKPFEITPGMRIAQLVLCPVYQAEFVSADNLAATKRGAGGFGHTGTH